MKDSDKYPKLKRERRSAEPQIEPAGEDDGQTRRASSPALGRLSRPHHGRPGEHRPRLHRCDAGLHEGPGSEGGSTARRPALRARPPPTRRPPVPLVPRQMGAVRPRRLPEQNGRETPADGRLSGGTGPSCCHRQRPHCLNKGSQPLGHAPAPAPVPWPAGNRAAQEVSSERANLHPCPQPPPSPSVTASAPPQTSGH